MENFRNVFFALTKLCCFRTDSNIGENLELEGGSKLDFSSSQIPKLGNILENSEMRLSLVVVESEKMQIGKKFIITPTGLVNSERNQSGDGFVYAGSVYYEDQKIINDIILPQSEKGVGRRHFMIQYKNSDKRAYLIKDLGDGMGTFIRLVRPLGLVNNFIISFGDSHMIVVIENTFPSKLVIKFIDGPKVDQKL